MKINLIIFLMTFALASYASAMVTFPFPGLNRLTEKSPDIFVAVCNKTPLQNYRDGEIYSAIEVISVLKGTNGLGTNILRSLYWPRQGEYYLIFGDFQYGSCQAFEEYRVIPLGVGMLRPAVIDHAIKGKPLEKQIQKLLEFRLDNLDRNMKQEAEEKKRLEEGVATNAVAETWPCLDLVDRE